MPLVWILTNGSKPHERSYRSAVDLHAELVPHLGEDVLLVHEEDIMQRSCCERGLALFRGEQELPIPQLVFVRIGSDVMDPNFTYTLLIHLEKMKVRLINSYEATQLATNKALTYQILSSNGESSLLISCHHNNHLGIPIPVSYTYSQFNISKVDISFLDDALGYPMVVKAVRGHGGRRVHLIDNANALHQLFENASHDVPFVFQEYIKESHGRDLRVAVIGGEVAFTMMRRAQNNNFCANLTQGGDGELVTGSYPEAEVLAIRIAAVLGMDVAGVDLLWSEQHGYVCCEVNNNFSMVTYRVYGRVAIEKSAALILRRLDEINSR